MEALYYHGVKRTKVCSLHFRREDSRNYLNGRIPERWFCFKFALSILLPRKGKHPSSPALSSFCYLRAEMHGKLMCRDFTIIRSSHRSGTLLCINCLQRGRMSSQSSVTILCSRILSSAIKVSIFGRLETLRQVAKIDHAQGQIQCSNTCMLFPCQNLLPSFCFLSSR